MSLCPVIQQQKLLSLMWCCGGCSCTWLLLSRTSCVLSQTPVLLLLSLYQVHGITIIQCAFIINTLLTASWKHGSVSDTCFRVKMPMFAWLIRCGMPSPVACLMASCMHHARRLCIRTHVCYPPTPRITPVTGGAQKRGQGCGHLPYILNNALLFSRK